MPASRIVVDRIEDGTAVLDVNGQTFDLPVSALPDGAREGSVLQLTLVAAPADNTTARLARMQTSSGISDDFTL